VALVGFEDQDNLGLRYLSSTLRSAGHRTRLVKLGSDTARVTQQICSWQPDVVGFSLIFQYLLPAFADLIGGLRRDGLTAHFTIGGHYPSFEPEPTLRAIPALDSVVRFEGEDTLLELTEAVRAGRRWQNVPGVAFLDGSGFCTAPERIGRADLDTLPWPDREDIRYEEQALPTASVLAGRGCPWRCSFCSIITFYEGNGTRGRRRRDPARVVDEVEHLHRERGVRVILWQDDDFLAGGRAGVKWAHAIARECIRRGLHRDLRWKISCRSDEIRPGVLEPLVEAGLVHVYMGVESGDQDALRRMNKHLTPDVHLRAGAILRELDLSFDFGFMLLEPWSNLATVRSNLAFLRSFVGDGAAVACFCRTLPYAGTPIADQLAAEGRLRIADLEADYAFEDPRVDVFYDWLLATFADRNHSGQGTVNLLRMLLFESRLRFGGPAESPTMRAAIRGLTAVSNLAVIDCIEAAVDHLEADAGDPDVLAAIGAGHEAEDARLNADARGLVRRLRGAGRSSAPGARPTSGLWESTANA
jgi:anaerobic magnesium-protoporphyrin IX monomethyl ester cyclase